MDLLFAKLEKEHPDHFAVKQYRKFKMAAGKTLKSILISCGARLAPFDIAELRDLMAEDELELDTLGDRKSALFVILSDTDSTFNFVAALMYSQLFNLLCDKADDFYGGRLPVHVRCLLDEFANIGQIPNFEKLIATIRSREISAAIILQSQSQLKTIYKDAADTSVYAHILDEDRKINAQKFESAFYANPNLREVHPPEEPREQAPATLDLEALVEQLRQSPELANTLAALLSAAPSGR